MFLVKLIDYDGCRIGSTIKEILCSTKDLSIKLMDAIKRDKQFTDPWETFTKETLPKGIHYEWRCPHDLPECEMLHVNFSYGNGRLLYMKHISLENESDYSDLT